MQQQPRGLGEHSDEQLEALLKDTSFDVQRAAGKLLDGEPSIAARRGDAPRQQRETKRPRTGEASDFTTPWTQSAPPPAQHTPQDVSAAPHAAELPSAELYASAHQRAAELRAAERRAAKPGAPPTPSLERRALEAEERADAAEVKLRTAVSGDTSWIFTAAKIADLGRTLARLVITPIAKLIAALPSQLAEALRKYDAAEAARIADAAAETLLERQVGCCRTCTEVGELEGLDFDTRHNKIYCLECERYADLAPSKLKQGARNWGVFDGTHEADPAGGTRERLFKTVKGAVKRHVMSGLHRWCEIHAVEQAARTRKTTSVGMTCAPLLPRAHYLPCVPLHLFAHHPLCARLCPCARLTHCACLTPHVHMSQMWPPRAADSQGARL